MTDEEKAEEYAENILCKNFDNDGTSLFTEDEIKKAVLYGLAEGRKEKWHDLRKDPNDRPIQDCDIAFKVYNYRTKTIISDIGFYRKKEDMFYHNKSAYKIISWCELPKFEE